MFALNIVINASEAANLERRFIDIYYIILKAPVL